MEQWEKRMKKGRKREAVSKERGGGREEERLTPQLTQSFSPLALSLSFSLSFFVPVSFISLGNGPCFVSRMALAKKKAEGMAFMRDAEKAYVVLDLSSSFFLSLSLSRPLCLSVSSFSLVLFLSLPSCIAL